MAVSDLEAQIRAAVAAGSQVHVWPEHFASGAYASVRSRTGMIHVSHTAPDPVAALRGALTEEDRQRRDAVRLATQTRDPDQIDLEEAIAAAPPADEFDGLLG